MVCFPRWLTLLNCITLHGTKNVKFANAQQAKQIYQYRNTKEKLCEVNAAVRYEKFDVQMTVHRDKVL